MAKLGRKPYLDGEKGLACFLVMFGHYCSLYRYAQNASEIHSRFLRLTVRFPISICSDSNYWLYLFFVISGYLLAHSVCPSLWDVGKKSVLRFFRLAIPVLGASLIILAFQCVFGFHNHDIQAIIQNHWLDSFYDTKLTLSNALIEPFRVLILGENRYNMPYWVLRDMFYCSILIYSLGWLRSFVLTKANDSRWNVCFYAVVLVALVAAAVFDFSIYFGCLAGMILCWAEDQPKLSEKLDRVMQLHTVQLICLLAPIAAFLTQNHIIYSLGFLPACLLIARVEPFRGFFSGSVSKFLGKLSFGIYSFHWPLFCSLGLLLIEKWHGNVQDALLYPAVFVICILLTCLLSLGYAETVERWASMFNKSLAHRMNRKDQSS